MIIQVIFLVVGFVLLVQGANWLVQGSSSLAKRFGIRDIVIGLTIVAFGTSAPEFIVNMIAAFSGTADIAIGNIVGSNIVNILLILGLSAVIYPLSVRRDTAWKEIPFALLAAVMVFALVHIGIFATGTLRMLTRLDGIILLLLFSAFLYYTYRISKVEEGEKDTAAIPRSLMVSGSMIIGGLLALVAGGSLIVDNSTKIALALGVSQSLIGLTIVAVGTSLPELATSAVAAFQRKSDIAVGNIVGSNIFNILFILATTSVITPLAVTSGFDIDILVMIATSFLLFGIIFVGKRYSIGRFEGLTFIALYIIYVRYLIERG